VPAFGDAVVPAVGVQSFGVPACPAHQMITIIADPMMIDRTASTMIVMARATRIASRLQD
jgi:hypothetical protein